LTFQQFNKAFASLRRGPGRQWRIGTLRRRRGAGIAAQRRRSPRCSGHRRVLGAPAGHPGLIMGAPLGERSGPRHSTN